jgi:hypothetical protein
MLLKIQIVCDVRPNATSSLFPTNLNIFIIILFWRQVCKVATSYHSHKVIKSDFKPHPKLNHTANIDE